MLKAKTKKFNGRSYKISPLKEGPYKKYYSNLGYRMPKIS